MSSHGLSDLSTGFLSFFPVFKTRRRLHEWAIIYEITRGRLSHRQPHSSNTDPVVQHSLALKTGRNGLGGFPLGVIHSSFMYLT